MCSIIMCSRACLRSSWRSIRPGLTPQGQYCGPQPLSSVSLFQRNSRFVSATANAHYPRHRTSGRGEQSKNKSTTKRSKDVLAGVQSSLEEAAVIVTEVDERVRKELGNNASFETYVKLTLSRLQPFLLYFVHHGPHEFLKGYAPPTSSMARARIATVYLYISAHAWFFHAMAAQSSASHGLSPDFGKIAEQFNKTSNAVEAYVEDKLPEGMTWAEVGGAILDSSSDAWFALNKISSGETGAASPDAPSTRESQKESPNNSDDRA